MWFPLSLWPKLGWYQVAVLPTWHLSCLSDDSTMFFGELIQAHAVHEVHMQWLPQTLELASDPDVATQNILLFGYGDLLWLRRPQWKHPDAILGLFAGHSKVREPLFCGVAEKMRQAWNCEWPWWKSRPETEANTEENGIRREERSQMLMTFSKLLAVPLKITLSLDFKSYTSSELVSMSE